MKPFVPGIACIIAYFILIVITISIWTAIRYKKYKEHPNPNIGKWTFADELSDLIDDYSEYIPLCIIIGFLLCGPIFGVPSAICAKQLKNPDNIELMHTYPIVETSIIGSNNYSIVYQDSNGKAHIMSANGCEIVPIDNNELPYLEEQKRHKGILYDVYYVIYIPFGNVMTDKTPK